MILRLRARPRRGFVLGVMLVCLVGGLLTGVELARSPGASAGTTGGPYGVYVSNGSTEQQLSLSNLTGGGSTVVNTGEATVTAINSTSTIGVVTTYTDFPAGGTVQIFAVPGNNVIGSLPIAAVGYAMDPANPNIVFSVTAAGEVDSINLITATSATLAALNPNNVPFAATSIAATPDGSLVLVGGILNSFGFIDAVPANGGAVTTWQGGLRDFQVDDLAVAPDGSALYAVADGPGFSPPIHLFRLPLAGFNPKSIPNWADPSAANPIVVTIGRSLTVSRDGQSVYLTGLDPNGQSEIQRVAAASGGPTGSTSVPIGSVSNGNGGFFGGVNSIALSPDGQVLLALGGSYNAAGGFDGALLYPISASTLVVSSTPANLGSNTPQGPEDVAVTPDQAPAANLLPASGTAGTPITLDASSSNVVYGSITRYVWNFGDGSPVAVTGTPFVSHTYGAQGNYTATVTETDSAGTSVPPAPFTGAPVNGPGTTPYLDASASARRSAPVAISPKGTPPPPVPTTLPHGTTTTTKPATYNPALKVSPTVGSPGAIVTISGTGFPPNKSVTVTWSTNTGSFQENTDAHGNLPAHAISILRPDILGPRFAVATTSGAPTAKASFLCVPNTAEPGGSQVGVWFRSEGP